MSQTVALPPDSLRHEVPELVRSYRQDVIDDLLAEHRAASASGSPSQTRRRSGSPRRRSPGGGAVDPSLTERAAAQRAAREAEAREKFETFRRKTERKQQEAVLRQEQEFQAMYQEVLEGLPNSSGIMGETQYILEHSGRIRSSKKNELHREWEEGVFDKIQDRLQRTMDMRDPGEIEKRLNSQMTAYLNTTNTKLGVFRDVIIEEDYNPLAAHAASIRIPTGDIRDPLKRDVLKPMYERQLMGESLPMGETVKPMLDTKAWGALNIKATPYGHCMDETGNYVIRQTSSSELKARASRVPMDHYGYPNFDNAAAMVEAGKGGTEGKARMTGPGAPRGMFGVLQQTSTSDPSGQNGDMWLEHKGKALPPGPEMRRGRQNLNEIIQQTSNPYEDKRTLGDEWLEKKGKALPPGPEARRGRQNLNEVIQQSSNPYKDGRSLGDEWLEAKGKRGLSGAEVTIGPVIGGTNGTPEPIVGGKIMPQAGRRQRDGHLVPELSLTVRVDAP